MGRPLVLESLEIHQFRAFRQLCVERLGRVNLVVGKNNVGKTCLLEGVWLYASRGSLITLRRLLESRDETGRFPMRSDTETKGQSARHLFHGRRELGEQVEPIHIGPRHYQDRVLSINVIWYQEQLDRQGQRQWQMLPPGVQDDTPNSLPGLGITLGTQLLLNYPLDIDIPEIARLHMPKKVRSMVIKHVFIPAKGLSREQIALLWDQVSLTDRERDVIASLDIIAPQRVEGVNLVGGRETDQERIPIVKLAGAAAPLPLRSLGEGMNRLFEISLALANAKGGILLVDEIVSGLHYSVQPALWRLILQMARRLDAQVFATTHSWDCVEAFQKAIQQEPQGDGQLISLRDQEGHPGDVVAVLFDESELAIVTREQIEVR